MAGDCGNYQNGSLVSFVIHPATGYLNKSEEIFIGLVYEAYLLMHDFQEG